MLSRSTLAHMGEPVAPHDLWTAWLWDPVVWVGVALTWLAYDRGRRRVDGPARARSFAAGLAVVLVALVSPLAAAAVSLASAHMVQHLLLYAVAAPLLVFGAPIGPLGRATPAPVMARLRSVRRRTDPSGRGRATLRHPVAVWLVATTTLWIWHTPAFYEAALRSEPVHIAEHVSFLVAGLAVWSVVRRSLAGRDPSHVLAIGMLFTLGLQGTLLAALMTFSPEPWYDAYATTTVAFGMSHRTDQHLAALLMWFPLAGLYLATVLVLVERWMRSGDRSTVAVTA